MYRGKIPEELAGVHDWENLVVVRASQVGLTVQEADKIIANIQRYG